jgi:CRISPR-associated protein Cas4
MKTEELLEENLLKLDRHDEDRYQQHKYHVSELVFCPRKSYLYRKLGLRPTNNGKMLSGTMLHSRLPDIVKGIKEFDGAEFEKEVEYNLGDISLIGHVDVLTSDCAYEFKYSGTNLKKFDFPAHYMLQANAYSKMTGRTKWAVVVVNSLTLATNILRGSPDDKAFESITDAAKLIDKALKGEVKLEGPRFDWECKWCDTIKPCREINGNELEET